MTLFHNERLRYAAYAILAALAALAYLGLGADREQLPIRTARSAIQYEELPVLQPLDTEADQEAGRDLFVFGGRAPITETILPAPLPAPSLTPEKPSLLFSVQALGIVRTKGSVTILVRVGTQLLTVGVGEPFGDGNALEVQSIQGRKVVVVERTSGNSRNFQLSEE